MACVGEKKHALSCWVMFACGFGRERERETFHLVWLVMFQILKIIHISAFYILRTLNTDINTGLTFVCVCGCVRVTHNYNNYSGRTVGWTAHADCKEQRERERERKREGERSCAPLASPSHNSSAARCVHTHSDIYSRILFFSVSGEEKNPCAVGDGWFATGLCSYEDKHAYLTCILFLLRNLITYCFMGRYRKWRSSFTFCLPLSHSRWSLSWKTGWGSNVFLLGI